MKAFLPRREFLVRAGTAACATLLAPGEVWSQAAGGAAWAERLRALRQELRVMGAAAAVVQAGKPVWIGCAGLKNSEKKEPVDETTVFQAASLSKPVFAYALLTLVAEGKFDLDKPLTSYAPAPFRSRMAGLMASEVPEDPRLKRITPRIVLSHSTGFPNWGRNNPLVLVADPGEKFGYSGEGYVYLQNAVEHFTGQPLDEFARRRVFEPLGMTSSSYIWRDDYETRAAIGYNRRGADEKFKPRTPLAAGTLHTTAGDFARFLTAILDPGGTRAGLNAEWVRRMLTPQVRVDESLAWGLGWGLERAATGHLFWQWGDDGEFKHLTLGDPARGTAVVVLTNSANGLRLCRTFIEGILGEDHPAFSFPMLDYWPPYPPAPPRP